MAVVAARDQPKGKSLAVWPLCSCHLARQSVIIASAQCDPTCVSGDPTAGKAGVKIDYPPTRWP